MKTSKLILSFLLALAIVIATSTFVMGQNPDYKVLIDERIKAYNPSRKDYVAVIDYKKGIFSDRLYVINVKTNETIIKSRVSHAWNSGSIYATDFSNIPGSEKSCYGTFITRGTSYGKFGYSMIVDGLDPGVNDKAKSRAIIFHPSDKMKTPWSSGCFATPEATNRKIIDRIKNGCLIIVIK
jgi:hypothetical protein